MKLKNILAIAAVAALAPVAMADVTINITGATAFRSAASTAIKNSFTSVEYAYNGASFTGATYQIFKGSLPGITGNTTIRTQWSGSVEGVRDLAQQNNIGFLPTSTTMNGTGVANAPTGSLDTSSPAQLAFSDVYASSTPYDNGTVTGENAGVIAFRMVANQGATITNITSQQFRALAGGTQPLSLFTGNASDTKSVLFTGRNDGSGTRVSVFAETGLGFTGLVQQWKATTSGTEPSLTISTLQLWPTGDGTNASFIYNTDTAGNGGYSSGGTVATALGGTTTSVQLKNAAGTNIGSPQDVVLVSYLGTNDSTTAVTNGAVALAYNGVTLGVNSGGITTPALIQNGQYTLWGYEHLFWVTGSDVDDLLTLKDAIIAGIPGSLGNAGLAISSMNVSRSDDGGLVAP
ncbi:MAG: hypothetical protein D4R65_12840 [Verrucomicrobiaceae bacterium]|nr:MAG: hypothetical protein D4R65_12840 [Verrucomicrobiaceae bacterium]